MQTGKAGWIIAMQPRYGWDAFKNCLLRLIEIYPDRESFGEVIFYQRITFGDGRSILGKRYAGTPAADHQPGNACSRRKPYFVPVMELPRGMPNIH